MTDSIFVYITDLPYSIKEMVCPCNDGYCVYLNARMSRATQEMSFRHAMWHIEHNDFEKDDIQLIEAEAHKGVIL